MKKNKDSEFPRFILWTITLPLMSGFTFCACEPKMNSQAKLHPYAPSSFFANGALAQHPVEGTVPHGVEQIPLPISMKLLKRGQSQFKIYCAPCHSDIADGKGMIVRHGFLSPPSFHTNEMRKKPAGFYFHVITHGSGAMYSYADRLDVSDRWAVVAYIRALQLSENFHFQDLTSDEREKLRK